MLIGYFTDFNIGLLYFILNLPLLIWGLMVVGKRFIFLSILSVAFTSWFMQLIPVFEITHEPVLAAVFGGALVGFGAGLSLRSGGSTAGFDIVGSILTRRFDFPIGSVVFVLNGVVILLLGYYKNNWDLALFSLVSIFVTVKLMDAIYIHQIKITLLIVTQKKEEMLRRLLQLERGVTAFKSQGAFSLKESDMLMTVTTRYELAELKKIIKETDPSAFVNILETAGVMGLFRKDHK